MSERVERKNASLNKEIKEEREHPEKIVSDVIKEDETSHLETDDFEPKQLDSKSSRLLLYAIGIILGLFALFFGASYILEALDIDVGGDTKLSYNGFSFIQDPETKIWSTTYTKGSVIFPMQFRYAPSEVDYIPLLFSPDELLIGREAILQALPPSNTGEYSVAAIEVVSKVSNVFFIPSKAGVFAKTVNVTDDDITLITCEDASDSVAVIIYQQHNETRVDKIIDNCYSVQGASYIEVVKAADRLVYGVLGIIQ